MGNSAVPLPAGFTEVQDPNFNPSAAAPADLPPGFREVPPPKLQEDNYFKQVKDRVGTMGREMYNAWKQGDFETMTGIPAAVTALNQQYYEALKNSQSPSEFALNLIPIFGPVLNHAASRWAKGQPQGAAAELTSDILLPLLAEKIPGALGDLIPSRAKVAMSEAGVETAKTISASAFKPPISGKPAIIAKGERAIATSLEEAIPASRGGMKTLVSGLQEMRDAINALIEASGGPRVSFELKEGLKALPPGPVDYELGPTVPPPGTTQTVLSHPEEIISETALRAKPNYTQQPATPARTGILLDQAKHAQLIADIDQRARESGLLEAVQNAARSADQPVPFNVSEVFNFRIENAVDPRRVAARLDQLKKRFQTVNPEADFAAIDAAKEEFLRQYPNIMSNKEAQALKVRTGQILSDKAFGELKTASKEAEKTLRRGLAEELEANIPELEFLNAREGDMIGLRPVLGRAIGRVRNWDLIGLATTAAAGVGGSILGASVPGLGAVHGAEAAALVAMALRDPWVKSKVAIAINRAAKINPTRFGVPSISAAEARVEAIRAHYERLAAGMPPAAIAGEANNPNPVIRPVMPKDMNVGFTYTEPGEEQP
jgi:hypothetical protein